jgi:hypothetical protein
MSEIEKFDETSDFIFYRGHDGSISVQVVIDNDNDTVWTNQKGLAEIFNVSIPTINYHLKEVLKSGEIDEISTIRKILTVQKEGNRDVERTIEFYNLDIILAVGYKVGSCAGK